MPINPNIAMGVNPIQFKQRDPYEEFSKQSQLQALLAGQADDELTRTAMRESGGDTESALKRLISGGGSLKAITGLQGMVDSRAKAKSEAAYKEAQTGKLLSENEAAGIARHRDMLSFVKDPQTAAQWVQMGYSDPVIGKRFQSLVPMEQALQSIPQDPAEFQSWVQKQGLGATKFIEMNKPVLSNRNLGNVDELTSTPGMGGAPTVLSSRPILESEAQRLARERQAADAEAGRKVTMRGQDLVNDRARERLTYDQGAAVADAGGASQAQFNKQFGKPSAGYRWKADGSQEFIPGGPADQKSQAKTAGEGSVDSVVAELRSKYDALDKAGGITNPAKGPINNLTAGIASSGVGQAAGRMFGTANQSERNAVAMTRPLLLQAIMKATGMSAKQMDSNAELKLYLATATDPTLDVKANREALDRIEQLYGSGAKGGQPAAPKPGKTIVRTGTLNGRKVNQYSDGTTDYAD